MKAHLLLSAAALCTLPAMASGALIASLDFADNGSAWTIQNVTTAAPLTLGLGGDLTNVGIENVAGAGQYRLLREVTAPAGFTMSNIVLTAQASGRSSWVMHGRIGFDTEPKNVPLQNDYRADAAQMPNGSVNVNVDINLDSTGNIEYTDITSIFVSVEVVKGLANNWAANNVRNIQIFADLTPIPEPASMGLLAAGGCLLVRRARRVV